MILTPTCHHPPLLSPRVGGTHVIGYRPFGVCDATVAHKGPEDACVGCSRGWLNPPLLVGAVCVGRDSEGPGEAWHIMRGGS